MTDALSAIEAQNNFIMREKNQGSGGPFLLDVIMMHALPVALINYS